MSKYSLKDLIKLWKAEKISQEQAIGQILLWLQGLQQQIYKLEKQRQPPERSGRGGARGKGQEAGGEARE